MSYSIFAKPAVVASLFCVASFLQANNDNLTNEEMVAYVVDFSYPTAYYQYQYKYLFRKRKSTPKWRMGILPVKRLNPEFKPELIKIIRQNQTLKGENKRLVYGTLYLLGYLADENDLKVLEKYLQKGTASIKENNGRISSYLEPIDFYDLGTCIGIMIARRIKGAEKFYLKYGSSDYWNNLNIPLRKQMYIVNIFACKVHEMSKNPVAKKRALQKFIVNGKKQCATLPVVIVNHDRMYKINRYMTLKNSTEALPPAMVKVFTNKMKGLHPNMFAYFGVQVAPSMISKQKANAEQRTKSLNNAGKTDTGKKLAYLKNIKIYSTAKPEDIKIIESDAKKYYQRILYNFKKKVVSYLIYNIADNGKPLCPVGKRINKRRYKSKGFLNALNETNVLIKAVEAVKHEYGHAIIEESTDNSTGRDTLKGTNQRIVVTIPLLKTKEVSKKFKLQNSPRPPKVIDEHGNILITMIYQDGRWYWNPFGW
jgi:hypothetical protein